ncbi:DNA mismatch repair protein MutS [Chrysiogenes arsenatis]|uniref:DNA mismatch repair protein MutS n=1 Tax=Chrysiogenes arsenatis TaxID=309797 RepID=UPI0003F8FBE5|nr:DNA mismatch repair protein MutS [Chrysiogenes arsenatis]
MTAKPLTPMMRQYLGIKQDHPDTLLLFRMGDFYELFGDDAIVASEVLGIAVTSRDKGEDKLPMAGVPHHALDNYLYRLVKAGHKVAICDQLEDPKQAKGIVMRGVTRIVTPATILNSDALDPSENNFLAALTTNGNALTALLWDLSTADVRLLTTTAATFQADLGVYQIAEYITPDESLTAFAPLTTISHAVMAQIPETDLLPSERRALSAAASYLSATQLRTILPHTITRANADTTMIIDTSTARNLELFQNSNGGREHSLLSVLDRTRTAMGGRMIRDWLRAPLCSIHRIEARHDSVEYFLTNYPLTSAIRTALRQIHDLERLINRMTLQQHRPRDLVALRQSLVVLSEIRELGSNSDLTALLDETFASIIDFTALHELLHRGILDEPASVLRQGNVIRSGYDQRLDELRNIRENSRDTILRMEAGEKERTGISSLKIRYNRVFGYYIEIPNSQRDRVPAEYIRKQTLVNAERYITQSIKELEEEILAAEDRLAPYEEELYLAICEQVTQWSDQILQAAQSVATIDVLTNFAELAAQHRYCRPIMSTDPILSITGLRHPVIETLSHEPFIANDVTLNRDDQQLMILTGPNMAGKSTYMRQSALAAIMAQMGSFVSARSATIGLCDRIFTRVGASDNLAEGKSTFMVEMSETSTILRHSTPRSLIIIDEVGRGTSTFDGISIAWSVAEYLSRNGTIAARTMFATHFHELTDLAREIPGVFNAHILISEKEGRLVFLRKVAPGAAPKSYGIEVARLAALPDTVVERAQAILKNLEAREYNIDGKPAISHIPTKPPLLFGPALFDPVIDRIENLDIDALTPREALQLLYELQREVRGE